MLELKVFQSDSAKTIADRYAFFANHPDRPRKGANPIRSQNAKCRLCADDVSAERLTKIASKGRVVSHTVKAEAKRSKTQLAVHANRQKWSPSTQPSWLTAEFFAEKIQAHLVSLSSSAIVRDLGVSRGYANEVRHGRVPHPRHWHTLAKRLGVRGSLTQLNDDDGRFLVDKLRLQTQDGKTYVCCLWLVIVVSEGIRPYIPGYVQPWLRQTGITLFVIFSAVYVVLLLIFGRKSPRPQLVPEI
jgi:hypothetical protein